MPAWTLGDIMSQATARIGFRSDLAQSTASFWVNTAYMQVAQEYPGALLETTAIFSVSSGDSRLSLPADFLEPITFSVISTADIGSARTLEPVSAARADATGYYPVGPTQGWYIYGGSTIQIWPSAASSYASTAADSGLSYLLRYRQRASDLTATSAVPSLDTEWRVAVLYLSEGFLHEYVGNAVEGALARQRYEEYARHLKTATTRRQAGQTEWKVSLPLRKPRFGQASNGNGTW